MVTESTYQTSADPVQLDGTSWRDRLARLEGFQWACLIVLLAASVLRDTPSLQWRIGNTYITIHLLLLLALSLWAFFRLLASGFENMPAGLWISGCLFCVYALSVDLLRAPEFAGPLAVDLIFVGCPVIVAAAFFGKGPLDDDDGPTVTLGVLLAAIMLLYMGVAYFAYSLDVGSLLGPRFRNLENLSFARISGPIGGATSLCLVTIPAIAFLAEKARGLKDRRILTGAIWILIAASVWTVSRVGILLLLVLLGIQFPKRRVIVSCAAFLSLALALNWGLNELPEKWLRLGLSDPGRVDALGTTLAAVSSDTPSLFTGVGSQRLNIVTQTSARVSRGELSFNFWATEFGTFPYGPHSIFLWALGSYGLVGVTLRCWFLIVIYVKGIRSGTGTFVWAVILSSLCLFLDDAHILYPFLMIVWLIFFIHAMRRINSARAEFS